MRTGQKIGYFRFSEIDNPPIAQLEGIDLDARFEDNLTADQFYRSACDEMVFYARKGDQVYVQSFDRIFRGIVHTHHVLDTLLKKGVSIHFIEENINFDPDEAEKVSIMLQLLNALSICDRRVAAERRRKGIREAKNKGVYARNNTKWDETVAHRLKNLLNNGMRKEKIAELFGVSTVTLYEYIKRFNLKKGRYGGYSIIKPGEIKNDE